MPLLDFVGARESSSVRDLRDGKCATSGPGYRLSVSVTSVHSPDSHNFSDLGSTDRLRRRQSVTSERAARDLCKTLAGWDCFTILWASIGSALRTASRVGRWPTFCFGRRALG